MREEYNSILSTPTEVNFYRLFWQMPIISVKPKYWPDISAMLICWSSLDMILATLQNSSVNSGFKSKCMLYAEK